MKCEYKVLLNKKKLQDMMRRRKQSICTVVDDKRHRRKVDNSIRRVSTQLKFKFQQKFQKKVTFFQPSGQKKHIALQSYHEF